MSGYKFDADESSQLGDRSNQPQNFSNAISMMGGVVQKTLGGEVGGSLGMGRDVFAKTDVVPISSMANEVSATNTNDENSGTTEKDPQNDAQEQQKKKQPQQQQQFQSLEGVASATTAASGFASSTEALHLTLMLRRTLSELESRSKQLNDANLEKVRLHGETEKCKLRLERLTIETGELQKKTEEAETKAKSIVDDEAANINAANMRATAAEKRFEILVDWSRKEEAKRIVAEETTTRALEKLNHTERTYCEKVASLNSDLVAVTDGLEKANASGLAKHKALMEREAQLLECSKRLAVSEQLSKTSQSEALALKSLCGKIEVELEGTKSRLTTVERARARESAENADENKKLAREKERITQQADEATREMTVENQRLKRAMETMEKRIKEMEQDRGGHSGVVRQLEDKLAEAERRERGLEERLELLGREVGNLKEKLWRTEKSFRDREVGVNQIVEENRELVRSCCIASYKLLSNSFFFFFFFNLSCLTKLSAPSARKKRKLEQNGGWLGRRLHRQEQSKWSCPPS